MLGVVTPNLAGLWGLLALVGVSIAVFLIGSLPGYLQHVWLRIVPVVYFEAAALYCLWSFDRRSLDAARLEYSLPTEPPRWPILDRI